jgi:PleD family two-component response regulator
MVVMSFNFVRTGAVFRCTSLAEKIRIAISLEEIDLSGTQEKLHVSVSIGFAIGATSWMELLENADRSLLRAKARGRNVVEG